MRAGSFLFVCLTGFTAWADTEEPPKINSWEYESVQAAIDQAPSPSIVLLPLGDYVVTEPLRLKDGVILDGQGSTVVRTGESSDVIPFTSAPESLSESTDFSSLNAHTVRLGKPIGFQTGDMARIALPDGDFWVSEVSGVSGRNVSFVDPLPSAGLRDSLQRFDPIEKTGLRNVTIIKAKNPFWFSGARDLLLENIRIEGNQLYSVIDQSYRTTVRALSKFQVNAGLAVYSSNQVMVQDSLVDQHGYAGIFLRAAFNAAVQNVQIIGLPELTPDSGLTGDGITIYRGENIQVSGVRIQEASCYGTWITEATNVSYSDVHVSQSLTHAFYVVNSDGVSLVRCRAELNRTGWGFVMFDNKNIHLRHNLAQRMTLGFFLFANHGGRWQNNVSRQTEVSDFFKENIGVSGL